MESNAGVIGALRRGPEWRPRAPQLHTHQRLARAGHGQSCPLLGGTAQEPPRLDTAASPSEREMPAADPAWLKHSNVSVLLPQVEKGREL